MLGQTLAMPDILNIMIMTLFRLTVVAGAQA
jgi:hypothetical protein